MTGKTVKIAVTWRNELLSNFAKNNLIKKYLT